MFISTAATASARSANEQIAADLVTAITDDAKTVWQIAHDAGMVYNDLLQFLGTTTESEPYTQAQKSCSLDFAAMVVRGLTDPTPFTIGLGFEMSPTSSSLTAGTHGVAYAGVTFSLVNGTSPVTFAVTSGTLPAGLSLNPTTGALAGTPTAAATSNFTIEGTDHQGVKASRAYSIVVANPVVAMSPVAGALAGGTHAVVYSPVTVSLTNGIAPITYAVTAGSLPVGLTLHSGTGVIDGTPTTAATYNFTITGTDSIADSASAAYSIIVA